MRKRVLIPLASVFLLATTIATGYAGYKLIPGFGEWLRGMGDFAPWALVIAFVIAIVLMGPSGVFCIAAGALFGFWWGMLWSIIATVTGSTACFLIARKGPRKWVKKKLDQHPRFERFDEAVGEDGLRLVVLLRLSPILPLGPLSYALGASRVRFRHFLLSMPAMIPAIVPFVYTGDVARSLVAVIRGNAEKAWWEYALLVAGLAATVAAAWILTRKARQALEARRASLP